MNTKILIFLLFILIGCKNSNKREVWVDTVCCMSDKRKIDLELLQINSYNHLEITFCNIESSGTRITLEKVDTEKKTSKVLFDLLSEQKLNKNKITIDSNSNSLFRGTFNQLKLTNGKYCLNLGNDKACGMIYFSVEDKHIFNNEFHCIEKCREEGITPQKPTD